MSIGKIILIVLGFVALTLGLPLVLLLALVDANKIDASKLDEHVFTSKEVLAQALVILFAEKIKEDITAKLAEIR